MASSRIAYIRQVKNGYIVNCDVNDDGYQLNSQDEQRFVFATIEEALAHLKEYFQKVIIKT